MKQQIHQLSEAEQMRVAAAFDCCLPRVMPADWERRGPRYANAQWFLNRGGLNVCFEIEMVDGALWAHVSLSRPKRMPDYSDLTEVKCVLLGPDRKAIMVLPAEREHFNLHPFCLHLYAPIDSDPLPDFRTADGQL